MQKIPSRLRHHKLPSRVRWRRRLEHVNCKISVSEASSGTSVRHSGLPTPLGSVGKGPRFLFCFVLFGYEGSSFFNMRKWESQVTCTESLFLHRAFWLKYKWKEQFNCDFLAIQKPLSKRIFFLNSDCQRTVWVVVQHLGKGKRGHCFLFRPFITLTSSLFCWF